MHRGNVFALRRDQVRMPGGRTAMRELVEDYGVVTIVAMEDDNNIQVTCQYHYTYGRRLWELSAGLLDIAGELPHFSAVRELQEEVDLQATTWQVRVDLNTAPGFSDESVRIYLAARLSEVARPEVYDEEVDMAMRWHPVDEEARRVFSGEVVNSIAIVGVLVAHAVTTEFVQQPCPLDSQGIDRPMVFAVRKAAQ